MSNYYLIDGTNLLYRAYHALQAFRTSKGLPSHAAYGFTSMIFRVIREHAPDALVVVFDPPGPTQKHSSSPSTKLPGRRPRTTWSPRSPTFGGSSGVWGFP
jgi:DNA polymerase-1